jgi:hypothetical protein
VYCYCALLLCTVTVYCYCVLCTIYVYYSCVLFTVTVYHYCVLFVCTCSAEITFGTGGQLLFLSLLNSSFLHFPYQNKPIFLFIYYTVFSFRCGAASESKSGCQRVLAKDNFTQLQGVPMCKVRYALCQLFFLSF